MNGRQENRLKIEHYIELKLQDQPKCITNFYYYLRNNEAKTKKNYILYIISFMDYIHKDISEINIDDVLSFLAYKQYKKNGNMTGGSYQALLYSVLCKFFDYLLASHKIQCNPMEKIPRPKATPSNQVKRLVLKQREIPKLISAVELGSGSHKAKSIQAKWMNRDLCIISLFLTTGIRCSALTEINLDDVDLDKKVIQVIDKGNQLRSYVITNEIKDIIQKWLLDRKRILQETQCQALFISNRKTRITQRAVSYIVEKYAKSISSKHITPHKLRATYGTLLYKKTRDIYFVQQCMGHKHPETTEIYIRDIQNQTKEASDIMTKLITV